MHSADFASPCRCRSCRENSSPLARRRWIAAAGVAASSTSAIASDGFLARCDSSCTTTPRACRDSFSARSVYHISRMCGAVNTERERIRIRNWMKIIFRLNKHTLCDDDDILSYSSAFECAHADCSCRQKPLRILRSYIWTASRRCAYVCDPEGAKVARRISRSVDTDTTDCACERASKRLALTRKLYHKWDNGALSCLAGFDVFVGVWRDLNLRMRVRDGVIAHIIVMCGKTRGIFTFSHTRSSRVRINKDISLTCRIFLPTFWTNVIIQRALLGRRCLSLVFLMLRSVNGRLKFLVKTTTLVRVAATAAAAVTRQTLHRLEASMMVMMSTIELMKIIFALCRRLLEWALLLPVEDFVWVTEQTFRWIIVRWDRRAWVARRWLPIVLPLLLCRLIAALLLLLTHIVRLVADVVLDLIDIGGAELASD